VFGDGAAKAAKRAKKLQDLLGEIHDCDVTIPRVEHHIASMRLEDAATLRAAASTRASDLDPKFARDAPHRLRYRGLETLVAYLRARRDVLYARFIREWERGPLTVTLDSEEGEPHG
jgi:hypothetical protein